MDGEDGYRIERKAEACLSSTLSFSPVATVYHFDDFEDDIDSSVWNKGFVLQSAVGSGEVAWDDGAVRLHTVSMSDGLEGPNSYNRSFLEVKNFAGVFGERDFDVQVDFSLPNGESPATHSHIFARLSFYFPQTDGNDNNFYIQRGKGSYFSASTVNGELDTASSGTSDLSGKLRLVRSNRKLSTYFWDGAAWASATDFSKCATSALLI